MARLILIVAYPGALGVELFGVRDLLEMANWSARLDGQPEPFVVEFATHDGLPVALWAGTELVPTRSLSTVRAAVHAVVVVGGPVAAEVEPGPELLAALRRTAGRAQRVMGLCTGSYILAGAGLLDGRRCTTHWSYGRALAQRYPQVIVDTDPLFITDGAVWTSGAVTSGFDMILAMISEDLGAAAARSVAALMALHLRRSGNQAQFGVEEPGHPARHSAIRELQEFVAEHPAKDHSLPALAARAHMSARHFGRVFRAEVGVSPRRYVERVRFRVARGLLEDTAHSLETIAAEAGFGNYQALRRAFVVELGITPSEYRSRFGTAEEPDRGSELQLVE